MLTIALLLAVPLLVRYVVTSRIQTLRNQLVASDTEYHQLKARYEHLTEDLRLSKNLLRQYETRQAFVAEDIRAEQQLLRELRQSAAPAPGAVRRAA